MTTHRYTLQPTRASHPILLRPAYHEVRDEIAKLETVLANDLAIIEARVLHRRANPTPPDPTPVPPAPVPAPTSPPVDMEPLLQPTGDQGQQGSCFAFAGTHAQNLCETLAVESPAPSLVTYSEACLSWNTRVLMGTSDQDSGGNLGDAIQSQEQTGTCLSALMPYNDQIFNVPPDAEATADEANHKAKFRAYPIDITDPSNIVQALQDGCPVYFGFWVWQGFEDGVDASGNLPAPDGSNLGGHAQLGFYSPNAPAGTFGDLNSWNTSWGRGGKCWFPVGGPVMEAYALVPVGA